MNTIDITNYTDAEIDALFNAPKATCPDCGATIVARPFTHTWKGSERIDYRFPGSCACGAKTEGLDWE